MLLPNQGILTNDGYSVKHLIVDLFQMAKTWSADRNLSHFSDLMIQFTHRMDVIN